MTLDIGSTPYWRLKNSDEYLLKALIKTFNIKKPTAEILVNRGIKAIDEADAFLYPTLGKIPTPSLMKDIKKGAERLSEALKRREKIAIYGDYDADGITACALMVLFLKDIGADVTYYVPERLTEGYGLNNEALYQLKNDGVGLVITVDCGIRDIEAVKYAKSIGLEVIITDHHIPSDTLPDAFAVINPKREDCPFPFKELAGCGVAFYFLIELRAHLRKSGFFNNSKEPNLKEYLDLVTIGTIADMVPLIGPNRIFVKYGLDEINKTKKKGLKILREDLLIETLDVRSISFRMAPRINASGRVSSPLEALRLLLTTDEEKAKSLVLSLNESNKKRQSLADKAYSDALKMMEEMEERLVYCLYSPEWHQGIIGIVASKLSERYNRPFFVFTDAEDGTLKGSGRSIEGFPLDNILNEIGYLLKDSGGHKLACGVSLAKENFEKFSDAVELIGKNLIKEMKFCKLIDIDSELDLTNIDMKFFDEINLLEPFGFGNPEPIFLIKDIEVQNLKAVGVKENHLKLFLKKDNLFFNAIGFSLSNNGIRDNSKIDIVGIPKITEFNGQKRWDFYIKDYVVTD